MPISPKDCTNMQEVRQGIDALDIELMDLLLKRVHYIDKAAELKAQNGMPARTVDRVEEVAMNARRNAEKVGFDPDLAEKIWRLKVTAQVAI